MGAPLEERHKVQVLGELGGAQQSLHAHHLLRTKPNSKRRPKQKDKSSVKWVTLFTFVDFGKISRLSSGPRVEPGLNKLIEIQ